jgi:hypothetical protein
MNRRVFFIKQDPRYDTSAVRAHSNNVVYLLEHQPYVMNPAELISIINRALDMKGFDPEKDLVATTGPFMPVAMMMWVLARRHPSVKVLMFDAKTDAYVERAWVLHKPD